MLNHALRYMPIVALIGDKPQQILEVGSGTLGLGSFLQQPFVGCDIYFEHQPIATMRPVTSSSLHLPFRAKQFDTVVSSDMIEHIPPELREAAVLEMIRVAKQKVIVGFPCGNDALQSDRELAEYYQQRGKNVPPWLQEHFANGFPQTDWLEKLMENNRYHVATYGNETIAYHTKVMHWESYRLFGALSWEISRRVPRSILAYIERLGSHKPPFYRNIYCIQIDISL